MADPPSLNSLPTITPPSAVQSASQLSLLSHGKHLETIVLENADIRYYPNFIANHQQWFDFLAAHIQWQQSQINVYGKTITIPRLNAWYGDEGADYSYSGHQLIRNPWIAPLEKLKAILEQQLNSSFNSVLVNYYRDGNDGVSWHADDEPELGAQPVIASLSFGAFFFLSFKHKQSKQVVSLMLKPGSLLEMKGVTQKYWLHRLPPTKKIFDARINLTFRTITCD